MTHLTAIHILAYFASHLTASESSTAPLFTVYAPSKGLLKSTRLPRTELASPFAGWSGVASESQAGCRLIDVFDCL